MTEEKILEKLNDVCNGNYDIYDLVAIATTDFENFEYETIKQMEIELFKILQNYGESISDLEDDEDSSQPHKEGYRLGIYNFWTHYTGVAGRYWGCRLALVNDSTLWNDFVGMTASEIHEKRKKENEKAIEEAKKYGEEILLEGQNV